MVFRMEYVKENAKISTRMNDLIQNLRFKEQKNSKFYMYNEEKEEYIEDVIKFLYKK